MTDQPPEPDRIPERHELSVTLRGLRVDADLSTPVLARRLGWSQSRVSRIDRGVTLPTPTDVEQWAGETGADADTRRRLTDLAERAQVQLVTWRRELAPGRRRKQQEMAQRETNASVIRLFGGNVVPGLAQTRPYAARMFLLGRVDVTDEPEDLGAVVDARMARQTVLDSGKRIELLCSEYALHRQLLGAAERRDQINHLIEVSTKPNVHVGVIPYAGAETVHQYNGFAIYGDPTVDTGAVVLAPTLTRGLVIRSPEEISTYIDHFRKLDAAALHGDELRMFLREVAEQTPR